MKVSTARRKTGSWWGRHGILYSAAIALIGFETAIWLWWAAMDIGVRLGVWAREGAGMDAYAFIASLHWTQEVFFFSGLVLILLTMFLLLMRSRFALVSYLGAFAADKVDWFLANENPYYQVLLTGQAPVSSYVTLFGQILSIGLVGWLAARGALK